MEKGKIVKKSLFNGAIIIASFGVFGKILGLVFKIPLTSILSSEGMGMYQIVFPLFVFLFTLSSHGSGIAVTSFIANNPNNNVSYASYGKKYTLVISLISAISLIALSPFISQIQGNKNLTFVYIVVAFCIISVSYLNYQKSLLRGGKCFSEFAFAETIEQIVKVAFALILSSIFVKKSVLLAVIMVFVSIFISTLIASFYVNSKISKYQIITGNSPISSVDKKLFKNLALIVSLSSIILPILQFIDSILVINLLELGGSTNELALSLYGLSRGTVSSIINLPIVFVYALEIVVLPNIVSDKSQNKSTLSLMMFLVGFICIPISICYFFLSQNISLVLFGSSLPVAEIQVVSSLLKIGSISILFAGLSQMLLVVLQGKNGAKYGLYSLIIAGIVRILASFVLIPKYSIYGAEIVIVLFYIVSAVCNLFFFFYKKLSCNFFVLLIPIISSSIMLLSLWILSLFIFNILSPVLALVIALLVSFFVYILASLACTLFIKLFNKNFSIKKLISSLKRL